MFDFYITCSNMMLLLLSSTKGDDSLRYIVFKREIFMNSPKHWHIYVKSFLQSLLKSIRIYESNLRTFSFASVRSSDIFLKYRVKRIKIVDIILANMKDIPFFPKETIIDFLNEGKHFMRSYSDNAYLQLATGTLSYSEKDNVRIPRMFSIKLAKFFSLNFTMEKLYFSSGPNHCLRGNLSFLEPTSRPTAANHVFLSFCGHYSRICVYPQFATFYMKIYISKTMLFLLDAIFSVMDRNIVTNGNTTKWNGIHVVSHIMIKGEINIHNFMIQVSKTNQVMIRMATKFSEKYLVYNGPGFLSPIISPRDAAYHCSSFQCVLQILELQSPLNYSSFPIKHLSIDLDPSGSIASFSSNNCTNNPCIIYVTALPGLQVNATLTKMIYTGDYLDSSMCQYGGIAVTEYLNNTYTDSYCFCENHDKSHSNSRSFYSRNSSFSLVLYWYKHYTEFFTRLEISTTQCTPVKLYYFTINRLCPNDYNTCNWYLSQCKGLSSINLMGLVDTEKLSVSVSSSDAYCVVFQFDHSTDINQLFSHKKYYAAYDPFKELIIGLDIVVKSDDPSYNINIAAKGILRPYVVNTTDTQYQKLEEVIFKDIYQQEDFTFFLDGNKTSLFKELNYSYDEEHLGGKDIYIKQISDQPLNFLMTSIPQHSSTFSLGVGLLIHTQSWIDVQIQKLKQSQPWRNTGAEGSYKLENEYFYIIISENNTCGNLRVEHNSVLMLMIEGPDSGADSGVWAEFDVDLKTKYHAPYQSDIFWQQRLLLIPERHKFISLKGDFYSAEICFNGTMINAAILKTFWIHNNYIKYQHFSHIQGVKKCSYFPYKTLYYTLCLIFPSSAFKQSIIKRNYIIFSNETIFFKSYNDMVEYEEHSSKHSSFMKYVVVKFLSSEDASDLCRKVGGSLPYFTSRNELEELIALMKLSEDMPPWRAIYIRLGNQQSV